MQEDSSSASVRTWSNERREFAATAREEDLDAREAALDEREQELDDQLAALNHLDDQAPQRRLARSERQQRRKRRVRDRQHGTDVTEQLSSGDHPFAAQFAQLATQLCTASSSTGVLKHLVQFATDVIGSVDAASVTTRTDERFDTPAASTEFANELDQLQYRHREGPCLDAVATSGLAYSTTADLTQHSSSWPRFAPAAATAGCRSVLALGMFPDTTESLPRLGSLNLYSQSKDAFTEQDRMTGLILAAHGAVAMGHATILESKNVESEQLRSGLLSRDVIGQAKGILMERQKCTPEQAFDLLKDASNRLNTKLVDLAQKLAETGESPASRK